jgi:NAD(P)-dependent dehydrogenase (short-subunit alcohol dehydrogenase family)
MAPHKSILITGCSAGGIGSALALVLAKRFPENHIFATARNMSKISEQLSSFPSITVLPLDVLSAESVAGVVRAVTDTKLGLDVLINNAGAGYATPILDMDIDKAKGLYETNIWGHVRLIQAFAGLLIASRGRVCQVTQR